MQAGALNYISKPVIPQKLLQIVEDSLSTPNTDLIRKDNSKILDKMRHFQEMVGLSKPIQAVYQKIQEVAPTDIPVLILGESGTGKELVAKAIHDLSTRNKGTFVAVNTGGIPKDLIASELFGHLKGAFTGAISDKKGKFEEAHEGTLFLDEISTMSIPVQISLLRVLETNVIERVGSTKPIKVNVRIICASNEDLQELIRQQKFREDLYYRLNVFNIELPPLRKRKQDIPYLVKYFRSLFNLELNKNIREISPDAMQILKEYSWPGNIRELRNVLLRAVLSAENILEVKHLPLELTQNKIGTDLITFRAGTPLSEVEKVMILQTLQAVNGNKLKAAEILGITRRSLYNKLETYQLVDKEL
jgi:DNA-binding NtrC family response regulator